MKDDKLHKYLTYFHQELNWFFFGNCCLLGKIPRYNILLALKDAFLVKGEKNFHTHTGQWLMPESRCLIVSWHWAPKSLYRSRVNSYNLSPCNAENSLLCKNHVSLIIFYVYSNIPKNNAIHIILPFHSWFKPANYFFFAIEFFLLNDSLIHIKMTSLFHGLKLIIEKSQFVYQDKMLPNMQHTT